jgi:type I restriction enzyme S subunit
MKKYDNYKDSGIEWIGEIPSHWDVKRGKEVLKFSNGYPFNSGLFSMDENEGFPLVRIRDLKSDKITTFYKGEIVRDVLINDNDFIIGMDGDFNIVKWNKGKALLNQRLCKIEGVNHLETNYLSYSLPFYLKIINDLTYYTTVKHLSNNDLFEQKFLVPNSQEQTAIANYLDHKTSQIDHLIAKKEQFINLLEEERVAVINQAVTKGLDPNVPMKDSGVEWLGEIPEHWEVSKIKIITTKIGSGVTPKGGAEIYESFGVPLLRSQNVYFDGFRLDNVAYITREIHESMSNSKVFKGDVLLNITGGSIGRCYFVTNEFEEANVNQHVCILRPNSKILTEFLYYILSSEIGQLQIDLCQTGGNREALNFEQLKNFKLVLPSVDEQTELIIEINKRTLKLNNTISNTIKEIELLKEYKTALISEVVTGKVDVSTSSTQV